VKRFFYRSYRSFYATRIWVEQRFSKGGRLLLVGIPVSAILGVDTERSMIYQVFTLLSALVFIAIFTTLFIRLKLAARRDLPRFGTAGEPLSYRVTFYNQDKKIQKNLIFKEVLCDPRPTYREFCTFTEPSENRRNVWDRKTMYFRWLWLISRRENAKPEEISVPTIAPHGSLQLNVKIHPQKRGLLKFKHLLIGCPDPLGIFKSLLYLSQQQHVTILPKRFKLPEFHLPGSRKYQPGGVALASSVGNAQEFISLREYFPGDPLRNIHWKSWAKVGKPIVKEYQDEFFERHALILDTFQSGSSEVLFEEAVSLAASIAYAVDTQESLLDLMFVGADAYCFSSGRGILNTEKILEILAAVTPSEKKQFSSLASLVFQYAPRLSGCICILLEWDELRRDFIQHLKGLGLPVMVLVIGETGRKKSYPDTDDPDVHYLETGNIEEGLQQIWSHHHF